jgi:threonine dehydratase
MTITPEAITNAATLIRPYVRRTPVSFSAGSDFGLDIPSIAFKHEYMQVSGSFKARGAFTNLLTREVPSAGVVAASGGNHGAAVAYAARALGTHAAIFVPAITSPAKAELIRRCGADLRIGGDRYQDALEASQRYAAETGALPIHAFEQAETMIGQGTLGLEIEQDLPGIDTLLVAVGGGGLIGGIAAWFESRVKIVAVEPEAAPTLHLALATGKPVDAPAGGIAADSLAPRRVGDIMFPFARDHVAKNVLVTDDAIHAAQHALWDTMRVVSEPGGAAAFAALLSRRYVPASGEKVAVLLCGANTSAVSFS